MQTEKYPLLSQINSPEDLRLLPESSMPALCREIRHFLVENVKSTGGHLASNLGVVELTVAIHRVFESPRDHLIFDVGHQSYVHKLLTGRRDMFTVLRRPGGMSGFTKKAESEHDPFGAGHSSTSVSAALGFATADRLNKSDAFTIAVLGDGAFTGGMVHEALNNCDPHLNLIIVLNENEMSISKNIGRFAKYIAHIRASGGYNKAKTKTKDVLNSIPLVGKPLYNLARDTKQFVKNSIYSSNYFEEMGLFYLGPADGNNYEIVKRMLVEAKNKGESSIIHIKTKKGKGYSPAEKEPNKYHGILPKGQHEELNFSHVMGEQLCKMAEESENICAVTAAMGDSTGLMPFKEKHPRRFFDVGIAEEHALTFSAALAAAGMRPYFAVYSSFLQRGYDNIIHDIALQNLPVCILIDRASFSAGDGPTHHGIYDVSMLGVVQNMTLFAPISFESLSKALDATKKLDSPSAIRYPNCSELKDISDKFGTDTLLPKADFEKAPHTVIVTYGKIVKEAVAAKSALSDEGIEAGIILLEQLMPYTDIARELSYLIAGAKHVIFLEEGVRAGGASMMLSDALRSEHGDITDAMRIDVLAIKDGFTAGELGCTLYQSAHISASDVIKAVKDYIEK